MLVLQLGYAVPGYEMSAKSRHVALLSCSMMYACCASQMPHGKQDWCCVCRAQHGFYSGALLFNVPFAMVDMTPALVTQAHYE